MILHRIRENTDCAAPHRGARQARHASLPALARHAHDPSLPRGARWARGAVRTLVLRIN